MNEIAEIIQGAIEQVFGIHQYAGLTRPNEQFGDFATNVAMQMSVLLEKNPREVAEELSAKLRENDLFLEVSVAGPGFINLRISSKKLADNLQKHWAVNYGENNDGNGRTVIVEYPSPNMAKPYSVGHLRPANQGWAARRLMEATGWKVITDNHLGDYGTPFGIWVTGFLEYSSEDRLEKDGIYELGRIYIKTKKALKEEAALGETVLADQVQNWLIRLESGDERALNYNRRFNKISLDHMHHVMSRLKISTDYELGEAFFAPKGKEIVQELLSRCVAIRNDDGSVIVPLDDYGIDVPILIQKSNGAALYATTDLATIFYREATWHPDRVIYAVGPEQQFYFTQLMALAHKLNIKTELIHLWFGLIEQIGEDGKREKMSSRKGVVLLEELLDMAEKKARQIVGDREVSDEDVKKIAVSAIKFSDFIADRRTNILFNWDNIFALSGFSGPYVQYAAVRVNKILRDNNFGGQVVESDYGYQAEKAIILKVLEYPEVVRVAARDLEPHKIATYLYELSKELNRYYENTPIATGEVNEAQKTARLELLSKVSHVFNHGLSLLGIEVPVKM